MPSLMSRTTIFLKLTLEVLYGIIALVAMLVFFDFQTIEGKLLLNRLIIKAIAFIPLVTAIWFIQKYISKPTLEWADFPRDQITEDSSRPWRLSLVDFIGGLCIFGYYIGLMLLAMFIIMTEGRNLPMIGALGFGALLCLKLAGIVLCYYARPPCRRCNQAMTIEHAKRPIDGESRWYVCFTCRLRAVAPSNDSGD